MVVTMCNEEYTLPNGIKANAIAKLGNGATFVSLNGMYAFIGAKGLVSWYEASSLMRIFQALSEVQAPPNPEMEKLDAYLEANYPMENKGGGAVDIAMNILKKYRADTVVDERTRVEIDKKKRENIAKNKITKKNAPDGMVVDDDDSPL